MRDNHYWIAVMELQKAGFSAGEIRRLGKHYRKYTEEETERAVVERQRLEFARWLVIHGRLSDQLA